MNRITIGIGRRSYETTLPENWAEVPGDAWEGLAGCMTAEQVFSRDLLHLLLRDRKGRKLNRRLVDRLPAMHLQAFFDCLGWLLTAPLDVPHLPEIKVGKVRCLMPAPQFRNLTVIEFAFVDMAWQLRSYFLNQQQAELAQEWTARLLSYVCRPADLRRDRRDPEQYEGDLRERFNSAIAEERWPDMARMKAHDQFWVLAYVAGCKQHLRNTYPQIWQRDERDPREIMQDAKQAKPQPRVWLDLCRRMSGGKFGTFEETQRTGLYTFLDELSEQLKDQKRRERDAIARRAHNR